MSAFTLVWSFRNRLDELRRSMFTADATIPRTVPFILVDGNSDIEVIRNLRIAASSIPRDVRLVESHYRTSLWQAWNLGIMLSDTPYIIFASSDVDFVDPRWIDPLVHYCIGGDAPYVLLENHAVFAVSRKLINQIGWFDEGFTHGGHADCDFMIRASEAGVNVIVAPNLGYRHGDTPEETAERINSEVKDRLPFNDKRNENYFKSKWASDWPGWPDKIEPGQHLPHPPTSIGGAVRILDDRDWHPSYRVRT